MATYILVPINFAIFGTHTVFVQRGLSATGPWVTVGTTTLVDGDGFFYDNTAPFDTQVWYRIMSVDGSLFAGTIGPFTLVSSGNIVLSDPLRPWADIEFGFCETPEELTTQACAPGGIEFIWARFGGINRRMDAGLFDRLDSETPADVWARRKNFESSAQVLTKTLAAAQRMYELFTAGGPLYLRAPTVYGHPDTFLQPGDVASDYLSETVDQRFPHRLWTIPYTLVDRPSGFQQGAVCATWCAVAEAFPTYAALTATGDTWADVAAGTTVCP